MSRFLKHIWHWVLLLSSGLALILISPVILFLKFWEKIKFRPHRKLSFFNRRVLAVAGIASVLLLMVLSYFRFLPALPASHETIPLVINQGESFRQIASKLKEMDLVRSALVFRTLAKMQGLDTKIYAGRYEFKSGQSMFSILNLLSKGGATAINVTIPPGLEIKQIAGILRQQIGTDSLRLIQLTQDALFLRNFGLQVKNLEGFLFPETYNFYWKPKEDEVIQTMVSQFRRVVFNDLGYRPSGIRRNELKDLVTLASLIEKEGLRSEEFPLISAVFHNRLKRDMPLQCDPTILYVLPPLNRPIRPEDLQIDSPYNTYKYYGLPPGPICNPGREALKAAMNPAEVQYLYFVHRGDGTHIFSNTLAEHNRAIWQLRKNKNS